MRILLVSHTGLNIRQFRREIIRTLTERGHEVVVCIPPGKWDEDIRESGARVRHYPLLRGSLNPLALPRPVTALRRIIREERPDVVHSFTHQPNIITRLAALQDTTVVNSVTGLGSCFLGSPVLRGLFKALYRMTADRCQTMVFQNRDDLAYFRGSGMTGTARTEIVRGSGVDVSRFRPGAFLRDEVTRARSALGIGPGHVVFTLTARLLYDKGVREFLEAARLAADRVPEARFLLVGEPDPGNLGSLTESEIEAAEGGNVIFAGWRTDMDLVWASTDVAVLPSYREGLPVSLQEALASGLPVIASDVAGCREIAGGEHCILVPVRESGQLAEAVTALTRDPDRRARMGELARRKAVREFDARRLAWEHLKLYRTLVARRRRAGLGCVPAGSGSGGSGSAEGKAEDDSVRESSGPDVPPANIPGVAPDIAPAVAPDITPVCTPHPVRTPGFGRGTAVLTEPDGGLAAAEDTARKCRHGRWRRSSVLLCKRVFDSVLVLLTLPIWLPLFAVTALLVRLRLGAPVFFRQRRPGLHGKPFTLIKFRTMTDEYGPDGEPLPDSERLPAFGRVLRSTSLDELPELLNVLRGEMSLVGPRPLLMEYLTRYTPEQTRRHELRPGITGLAQVSGRNSLEWPEVFRMDVEYVDCWSPWLDLKILALTVLRVVRRSGVSQPGEATRRKFTGGV